MRRPPSELSTCVQVIEEGTHSQLLELGTIAMLWNQQKSMNLQTTQGRSSSCQEIPNLAGPSESGSLTL